MFNHGKTLPILAIVLMSIGLFGMYSVLASQDPTYIQSPEERQKIFHQVKLTASPNQNYLFSIIITPTGEKQSNVILSPDNLTALQNNVAFFTPCGTFDNGLCQPPIPTTSNPNENYCSLSLWILNNQDGYLPKLFNQTSGKDLTPLVYPNYCFVETGKNPVNGQGSNPTPSPVTSTLSIRTDKQVYSLGDKIQLFGTSPNQVPDIGIIIRAPNGNLVSIDQTTAINGVFTDSFQTGGQLWQQTGNYTIKAVQGDSISSVQFVMSTPVPEFAHTVAIISVIAVLTMIVISVRSGIRK